MQFEKKYLIEEVRQAVEPYLFDKKKTKIIFDGDAIKANSERYQTFFTKGCKCAVCGLEGQYFKKKFDNGTFHLNLYGIKDGKEILFTKDHIIPKSKGGRNCINNYQTMCYECNENKADN